MRGTGAFGVEAESETAWLGDGGDGGDSLAGLRRLRCGWGEVQLPARECERLRFMGRVTSSGGLRCALEG